MKLLGNVKGTEWRLLHGGTRCGLDVGWNDTDVIKGRFYKKLLRIPRFVANGVA